MSSIFEVKADIKELYDDVVGRTKDFLSTYDQKLVDLPSYDSFEKVDNATIYNVYNNCLKFQDEVVDIMVRVELIHNQMTDILNDGLGEGSYDNRHVRGVKDWIKNKAEILDRYRFTLLEVRRLVSDRLKVLQSSMFRMGW